MPVRFHGEQAAWIDAATRDIGVGGAFIQTTSVLAVGAALTVEITLPTTAQLLALPAIVRWVAEGEAVAAPGMGVQFVGVDVDLLLALDDYFASLNA